MSLIQQISSEFHDIERDRDNWKARCNESESQLAHLANLAKLTPSLTDVADFRRQVVEECCVILENWGTKPANSRGLRALMARKLREQVGGRR